MHIVLVGLNHASAPIELRERLAFRRDQVPAALARLRGELGLHEAAILSTCNRVEIYASTLKLNGTVDRLQRFLSEHGRMALPAFADRLYSWTEPQSIRHLFAVTSGLDSMVIGEGEILHQVKHAYEWAREAGATDKLFNALFQRALNAAKAVRSRTAIGRGCTSIGSVSLELAEKVFGTLSGAVVLLIGAGKIGEVTLKRLTARGVREIRIMNRSFDRAAGLAAKYGAIPLSLDALPSQLREVDMLITSTSAPACLLRRDEVMTAMRDRRQQPLCLIDLGVPRNIEPAAAGLENVYLFDVDDLRGLVGHSHQARLEAVQDSHAILDRKVERFLSWWRQEAVPCVPSCSGLVAVR